MPRPRATAASRANGSSTGRVSGGGGGGGGGGAAGGAAIGHKA